ncbi:hypothetical protein [Alcanivorax sp.]|uniref:P-loop ATPase, Sll1717 family n=1 Tax=Alcanivorax sp. TaxID=1872427 RepID=UPI00263136CB|nr:hypothetical protein [Alcanivorax sp.]
MAKVACKLKDPFPVEELSRLDIGNFDGHRDAIVEKVFIPTRSIETFRLDKHSVIVGAFGTGKSAIFNLVSRKSQLFPAFKDDLIVTINEQIQFDQLKGESTSLFPSLSDKLTYQLIWKFQVFRRVSEEIAKLPGFPNSESEKYIGEFLTRTGGKGGYQSILSRLRSLFENVSVTIKTKLSQSPIDVKLGQEAGKAKKRVEINLDSLMEKFEKALAERNIRRATILVDKLDKFVAGEDYQTQKSYIESLLEVEDDLFHQEFLGFKIFIRSDLYDRLDFSSLGPDKAEDNTLRLKWSKEEIRSFVAKRLYIALHECGIWDFQDVFASSDLSDYSLKWHEKILLNKEKEGIRYHIARIYSKFFGRQRNTRPLYEKMDLIVVRKLFSNYLLHECEEGNRKSITPEDFLDTHFLDGNDSCTPRYMLVFLKEIIEEASHFYTRSPDIHVTPILSESEWVYQLFTPEISYKAYISSKEKYIRHVSKVDEKWADKIKIFLDRRGNKKNFDFKWIKSNLEFKKYDEEEAIMFMIYLKVIGFLKETKFETDIKKRQFEIPILYRKERGAILNPA